MLSAKTVELLASMTYPSRKAVFDYMAPADLQVYSTSLNLFLSFPIFSFLLSAQSEEALDMITSCALEATLSINFTHRNTTIDVHTPNGGYSSFLITPYTDENGIQLDVNIDGELIERCYLTGSELILHYGLEIVLRRLFNIYRAKRTSLDTLDVTILGFPGMDVYGLGELLNGIKNHATINHLVISNPFGKDYRTEVFGLDKVFEAVKVKEAISMDVMPLNFPLDQLNLPHLTIYDTLELSEEFITGVLMALPNTELTID